MEEPKHENNKYMMTGALQFDEHEGEQVKWEEEKEEEGPVWAIGYEDYMPPSLKKQGWKRDV